MPGGQITFDVDLSRPITDAQEPAEQQQNLGVCRYREFTLPSAYEARYTNYPNAYLARYKHDVNCAHSIVGIFSCSHFLLSLAKSMVSCLFVVCCASMITS